MKQKRPPPKPGPKKQKRTTLTVKEKLKVCDFRKKHSKVAQKDLLGLIAKELGWDLAAGTLCTILKQESELRKKADEGAEDSRRDRKAAHPELEAAVLASMGQVGSCPSVPGSCWEAACLVCLLFTFPCC